MKLSKNLTSFAFMMAGLTLVTIAYGSENAKDLARANNEFGLKLYEEVLKDAKPGENTFISPISAAQALQMLLKGAEGSTLAGIHSGVELKGLEKSAIGKSNRELLASLMAQKEDFDLSIANSVWMSDQFEVKNTFLNSLKTDYNAETRTLDFADTKSLKIINGWVNDQTHGKIPSILNQISGDDRMFLINATYFKADWMRAFEKNNTTRAKFGSMNADFMNQTLTTAYLDLRDYQAIRLPYGKKGKMGMIVILPKDENELPEIRKSMLGGGLEKLLVQMNSTHPKHGTLSLPKFTFETSMKLKTALAAMGMGQVFSSAADLSGISDRADLSVSDVVQKTFVKVDEKGTEAAAVTSITIVATSVPVYDFHMVVNRPFFFMIADQDTGSVLFAGQVYKPESKN